MTTLLAHFDGKVLVPDSPVKLPVNQPLKVSVSTVETNAAEDDMNKGAWLRARVKKSVLRFPARRTRHLPFHRWQTICRVATKADVAADVSPLILLRQ